jgi:hypothetical protein
MPAAHLVGRVIAGLRGVVEVIAMSSPLAVDERRDVVTSSHNRKTRPLDVDHESTGDGL